MPRSLCFLLVALASVACGDRAKPATDSELAHDISLAAPPSAPLEFRDTALSTSPVKATTQRPPTPSASRKSPRPAPVRAPIEAAPQAPAPVAETAVAPAPAPAAKQKGFQAGVSMDLTTKGAVCTTNLPGDKIVATLNAPVTGDNGAYIPAGATVVLEVGSVVPGDTPETARISLRVRSIFVNDVPVSAEAQVAILSQMERREVPRNGNSDRNKVVGGAIAGAVIGQILGKNTKSTVIGAAAGAAAGTAAAVASRKFDACLPAGSGVRVTTTQPILLSD